MKKFRVPCSWWQRSLRTKIFIIEARSLAAAIRKVLKMKKPRDYEAGSFQVSGDSLANYYNLDEVEKAMADANAFVSSRDEDMHCPYCHGEARHVRDDGFAQFGGFDPTKESPKEWDIDIQIEMWQCRGACKKEFFLTR